MRIWRFYKCFCILLSWHTFALGWQVRDWLIRCYSATCSSLTLKALFFLMAIRFIPWVGFIYTFVLVYNAILAQNVSSRKKIISKLDYIQKKTVCRVIVYPAYSQIGNVTYLFSVLNTIMWNHQCLFPYQYHIQGQNMNVRLILPYF